MYKRNTNGKGAIMEYREGIIKVDVEPFYEKVIVPFACIDSSWGVRFKFLWEDYAGPAETYTGYIDYIDSVPWGEVLLDDGSRRSSFMARQAQYKPKYAGEIIGSMDNFLDLLNYDGIRDKRIAVYMIMSDGRERSVVQELNELFWKDLGGPHGPCPVVMSRPMTYVAGGPGTICDNSKQEYACNIVDACDHTLGLRELGISHDRQFFADYLLFWRDMYVTEIGPRLPVGHDFDTVRRGSPRLVVYMIGAGSIGRIRVNGDWHIVSPGYFPPYGDPYNFIYNGHKAVINDFEFDFSPEVILELDVEYVAPRPEDLGAQVVFAVEYRVPVSKPKRLRPIVRR